MRKAPFIGILAFMVVLFTMPIGHMVMILIESIFGHHYQYPAATLLGLIGALFLLLGAKSESESSGTWLGFFAGIFIWTGWVEFSFVYFASHLDIAPLLENGEVATKPEYLMMPSSIGIFLATSLYFFFNKDTRCHFFRWFHRHLKLKVGKPSSVRNRTISSITAMETIYITWFFYIVLLLVYDESLFGQYSFATYSTFFISLVWSLYLFIRLIKFKKMAPAVRYAIPTVIIFWNAVEILGRWNFFEEIWIQPQDFVTEMILIVIAFISVTVISILMPTKIDDDHHPKRV